MTGAVKQELNKPLKLGNLNIGSWARGLIDAPRLGRRTSRHMLNHLPLAWNELQRLGYILADLLQRRTAATRAR